jgi:hypothetical protein
MKTRWKKLGRIFVPDGSMPFMRTHSSSSVPRHLGNDRFRVYCAGRDEASRASICWYEFDITNPQKILAVSPRPVLERGALGTFDDSGVVVGSIVSHGGRDYMYYSGWNVGRTVPFWFWTGLAFSDDGGLSAARWSPSPVLDRDRFDPCSTGGPCVIVENGLFRCWYSSCIRWDETPDGLRHFYHLKYAESHDGIRWERKGHVAIDFVDNEYAIARPTVIRDGNRYKMWHASRGESYRIGYAESDDGITWERMDDRAGIDVSESGWDSEMIEYPYVFDHGGERYMLYNGNGYGRSGTGLAIYTG